MLGVPSKYLSILHNFKKDIVSWNLSPLQLRPHNSAESSDSRLEEAVFVQPTHFLVEAGREPWGTEHLLLRSLAVGISPGHLCSAALELF